MNRFDSLQFNKYIDHTVHKRMCVLKPAIDATRLKNWRFQFFSSLIIFGFCAMPHVNSNERFMVKI
jgi:hypothetical protein